MGGPQESTSLWKVSYIDWLFEKTHMKPQVSIQKVYDIKLPMQVLLFLKVARAKMASVRRVDKLSKFSACASNETYLYSLLFWFEKRCRFCCKNCFFTQWTSRKGWNFFFISFLRLEPFENKCSLFHHFSLKFLNPRFNTPPSRKIEIIYQWMDEVFQFLHRMIDEWSFFKCI